METKVQKAITLENALRAAFVLLLLISIALGIASAVRTGGDPEGYVYKSEILLLRDTTPDEEGYEEGKCEVGYTSPDGSYSTVITYTFSEWEALGDTAEGTFSLYENSDGDHLILRTADASADELARALRDKSTKENEKLFIVLLAVIMLTVSFGVIAFFGKHFTLYEKIWFLSILSLSAIVSIIFPEGEINGINGLWIMALYLADTFLNILCELLISKQSRWNFIVSVFVEIVEIAVCLVLSYRFATMAVTLFFWLPCDIISFVNWNKKRDCNDDEITKVRTLKGWQEVALIAAIIAWTVGIGALTSNLNIISDVFGGNRTLANIVCYIDAMASAVGIMNGLAILFRFREQWIAWYICAFLEAAINIIAGQWVLLVLKLGYIMNTTYGYIKWTGYIKEHPEVLEERSIL